MEQYKKLLSDFIAFQSISTDPAMESHMEETANWLHDLFTQAGFEAQFLHEDGLNPVVYASYEADPTYKTVLVYGHYDVQPADKENGWDSEPFELTQKDGSLRGRGVVDNKGQVLIHIFTVLEAIKNNSLKYNVKFIIEGNEETGGVEEVASLMEKNTDLLKSDYVVISDGEQVAGHPAFDSSFRGGFNLSLTYKVSDNNVHSGIYGGAVANSAHEASKLISKMYTDEYALNIEGIKEGGIEITKEMEENTAEMAKLGGDEAVAHPGFKKLLTEDGKYDFYAQTGLRPTVQVTGFKSGYIGDGFANIVPAETVVKFNFRTAPLQDTQKVIDSFKKFVAENTPDYVEYEMEVHGAHASVYLDTSAEIFTETREILKDVYGKKVFNYHVGGAIPFVAKVKELFGIDAISVGLANEDCNMHGANENFKTDLVQKGLEFSKRFWNK